MKVIAEIDIPDGWFRAPNGNNDDTIWWHRPEAPDRPYEVENVRTVNPLIWQILAQVVPAACPSHPTTPGFFPCGNVCALGQTDCPVPPPTGDDRG